MELGPCISRLGRGFCLKFGSVYAVEGAWSLLTDLLFNRFYATHGLVVHVLLNPKSEPLEIMDQDWLYLYLFFAFFLQLGVLLNSIFTQIWHTFRSYYQPPILPPWAYFKDMTYLYKNLIIYCWFHILQRYFWPVLSRVSGSFWLHIHFCNVTWRGYKLLSSQDSDSQPLLPRKP